MKIGANFYAFYDNCVGTSCGKISILRWEYMWLPVNLLKQSRKISDLTKRDVSVLDFSDDHGEIA